MDYQLAISGFALVVGAVAGGFKSFKTALDLSQVRRGNLRAEYKFAKEFLTDYQKEAAMHPYLEAKGLQAIAGTVDLSISEIKYLLSLKNAAHALRGYTLGKDYLQHLPERGNLQIDFKKKYKKSSIRKSIFAWYIFWYGTFVLLSTAPLLIGPYILSGRGSEFGTFLITLSMFGPCAFLSLNAAIKLKLAEQLVINQKLHTQAIITINDKYHPVKT